MAESTAAAAADAAAVAAGSGPPASSVGDSSYDIVREQVNEPEGDLPDFGDDAAVAEAAIKEPAGFFLRVGGPEGAGGPG